LTFITFAYKNQYFVVINCAGSSPVKRSIDLWLIRELPLILGIWLNFCYGLSVAAANKRVYMVVRSFMICTSTLRYMY